MYNVNKNIQKRAYEMFGKTEKTANEDVEEIRRWLQTQPHFPEIMSDAKIKNFLNLCKFNIEKTKEKIDNYYTAKSKYPQLFSDANPKLPHMRKFMEEIHLCNHPELLDGLHRVLFIKWKGKSPCDTPNLIKLFFSIYEMRLEKDLMIDDVVVVDFANITFKDMIQTPLLLVYKSYSVYRDVFSLRLKEMHFVHSPSYISFLMKMLKLVLSQKLYDRIKVHQDAASLKEIFPAEMLPKDYGGDGLSLDELDEMMKEEYNKNQERFDVLDGLRVNENLRPRKQ